MNTAGITFTERGAGAKELPIQENIGVTTAALKFKTAFAVETEGSVAKVGAVLHNKVFQQVKHAVLVAENEMD